MDRNIAGNGGRFEGPISHGFQKELVDQDCPPPECCWFCTACVPCLPLPLGLRILPLCDRRQLDGANRL